jgi:GT2 family glycosyltransferase
MKRHYCTYFDRNYLVRAVALVESLRRHEAHDFTVYAICHDELSRQLLNKLGMPEIVPVPMHDLERHDKPLLAAKQGRTHVEYFWTATPTIILRLLEWHPEIDVLTYLDADLFFFSSPEPIFAELGKGSVLIHEHRYSPAVAYLEPMSGRFNVGLLSFRNDAKAREVLAWWRDRCNEWCFARCEPGRMGDQYYLNEWPTRFPHVRILQHVGGGVAPWNHDQYAYREDASGDITVDGRALIFYHFHALAAASEQVIVPVKHAHYPLTREIAVMVFVPYAKALERATARVREVMPGFSFGLGDKDAVSSDQTIIFHRSARDEAGPLNRGEIIEADNGWACYWPHAREVRVPASGGISQPPRPPKVSYPYKVTALVSTYKSAAFIAECLTDLVGQTIADRIEIIVVDADSPEGEGAIVAEFQKRHPNIKYIRTPERIGVYAAWNMAILASSGEYLISVSTNDRLRRDACELLARTLDENPQIALAYGDSYLTRIPHQTFEQHTLAGVYAWPKYSFERLLQTCMVGPHPMWRRTVHDHVGLFDESFKAIGDQDMWLRIGEKFELMHVPLVTGLFWTTEESLSGDISTASPEVAAVHRKYQARLLYRNWMKKHSLQEIDGQILAERMFLKWQSHPDFHFIIAVRAGAESGLADTIDSLSVQMYNKWRLSIVADFPCPDPLFDEMENLEWIQSAPDAVNEQVERIARQSQASWVCPLLPGVQLEPHFLIRCGDYINLNRDWRLIYFDEDVRDQDGLHYDDKFKPDFNLDLLRSFPYTGFPVYERAALTAAGAIAGCDRTSLYDAVFRVLEHHGEKSIGHIADVLMHLPPSLLNVFDEEAEKAVVARHLIRAGVEAEVGTGYVPGTYRVTYSHPGTPLVSIIIPTKNKLEFIQPCIDSVLEKTSYPSYEILVVDNGSDDPDVHEYYRFLRGKYPQTVRTLAYDAEFNFSAMNNLAAAEARGEYLLLLNNDTQIVQREWLERMLNHAQRPEVGVVGARLVYPETGKLQHAGVVLGMSRIADHPFNGTHAMAEPGYMNRAQVDQNYSAVTAACMLVRRSVYEQVGGMDDEDLKVLFNDIDFCLKVGQAGRKIVWTPYATVVHHGSASLNGEAVDLMKLALGNERAKHERAAMMERWLPRLANDPAYNRHLSFQQPGYQVEGTVVIDWDTNFHDRPRILASPLSGGSGEYRVIGPFRALSRAGLAQCDVIQMGQMFKTRVLTPVEIERAKPDTLVLQAAVDDTQMEALELYKQFNPDVMRVFTLDDLLTQVPKQNSFYRHSYKDAKPRLRKALALCDRAIVTTEPLAELCRPMIGDVRVIPNRLERALWGDLKSLRRQGAKPRVGWAGAQQHAGDLALITDVVKATAGEVDWVFFGMCPEALRPYLHEFHDFVLSFYDYPAKLASLNLDLAVAPLEINAFNEAKSNLRLLEYGILGWPVVCSDVYPYQGAPVKRVANDPQAWVEAIRERAHDLDAAEREGAQLKRWVLDNFILEDHLDEWVRAFVR